LTRQNSEKEFVKAAGEKGLPTESPPPGGKKAGGGEREGTKKKKLAVNFAGKKQPVSKFFRGNQKSSRGVKKGKSQLGDQERNEGESESWAAEGTLFAGKCGTLKRKKTSGGEKTKKQHS